MHQNPRLNFIQIFMLLNLDPYYLNNSKPNFFLMPLQDPFLFYIVFMVVNHLDHYLNHFYPNPHDLTYLLHFFLLVTFLRHFILLICLLINNLVNLLKFYDLQASFNQQDSSLLADFKVNYLVDLLLNFKVLKVLFENILFFKYENLLLAFPS